MTDTDADRGIPLPATAPEDVQAPDPFFAWPHVPTSGIAVTHRWSEDAARRIVMARNGGWCERCGRERATTLAHRMRRSQMGRFSPDNLMALCGHGTAGCEGWVTAEHDLAVACGLQVEGWDDPLARPAFLHHEGLVGWWWLTYDPAVPIADPRSHVLVAVHDLTAYDLPEIPEGALP